MFEAYVWNMHIVRCSFLFNLRFYSGKTWVRVCVLFLQRGPNGFWRILHTVWGNAWTSWSLQNLSAKWKKKNAITLHFTLMASCHVFHVCTDPLTPRNGKCSLLATKGQTLGNEHFFFFFFAFLPPKNINRQQWERKDWKKGIMANPLSRAKSRSSNIRPKILMTASRLFFYKKNRFSLELC